MTTMTIISSGGTDLGATFSLAITNVSEKKNNKVFVIKIPGKDSDYIQDLGLNNRVFEISGLVPLVVDEERFDGDFYYVDFDPTDFLTVAYTGYMGKPYLRSLIGRTGSISSDVISSTNVYFESVEFEDNQEEPGKVYFKLNTIEII